MLVFLSLIEILALKAKLHSKTLSALSGLLIFISCHLSVLFSEPRGFTLQHITVGKKKQTYLFFITDIRLFKGEIALVPMCLFSVQVLKKIGHEIVNKV